ncbi:MAG: 5-(carboxyamino)imidazole ribonucleotide synthase [Planctomycetia bacterium]|nr:5-(carboxyamino)imidazole ribonucleotide synthase [Planctomycetia bacterium]
MTAATGPLPPGARLGVLGGGQLGMMFAMAARRMGYRVEVFSDVADCPAARHCDRLHVVPLDDPAALVGVARGLDALTFEFENVSAAAAGALAAQIVVRPAPAVLHTVQDRGREKAFLVRHGFPVVPHALIRDAAGLEAAVAHVGLPAVLKTAAFGYDGKGQRRVVDRAEVAAAWQALGPGELVLESWVDFIAELSVVAARGADGAIAPFTAVHNRHRHHILDVTTSPAPLPRPVQAEAERLATAVLEALDFVGVGCVEFFLTGDGRLLVNEIAPRPHNSGHLTVEACACSQFEQQVRAVCGLPLGSPRQLAPAAMANLLGDCWAGGEPDWPAALALPGVSLTLYGKSEPRPGRKMGHLTVVAATVAEAEATVLRARDRACRS